MNKPVIYIMGVSGSGKSTIGQLLSQETRLPFFDGDNYHPEANIKKMASGKPLNDDDRAGWLHTLNEIARKEAGFSGAIIVCSALKESYRKQLSQGLQRVIWVFLDGDFETISRRLETRDHEFMPAGLLRSQFHTLEKPGYGLHIDINHKPAEIVSRIKHVLMKNSEFGLLGLGVMGKSIARNLARNGFRLSLYNRHVDGSEEQVASKFIANHEELSSARGFDEIGSFVNSIESPRKILIMVEAGAVTGSVIENLLPHLQPGDTLIDGGNTHYRDTERRMKELSENGIHLIGAGISGGEEGALNGPSIMPSGDKTAYENVQLYLETIAAKDGTGEPCCRYIGPGASGHFVKMVHNGIEYAEMQLIAEIYQFLRFAKVLNPNEIADIFEDWCRGDLNSYLLEISVDILRKKEGEAWLIDLVLDQAANKGTGSWATIAAAEYGVPATMIASALFARYLSAFREERNVASYLYEAAIPVPSEISTEQIGRAYQAARVVNHHQGMHLLTEASKANGWNLKLWEIAQTWTNGCIIRSSLMEQIIPVLQRTDRLLLDEAIAEAISFSKSSLEKVAQESLSAGFDSPCLTTALGFIHGYATDQSVANIIQAQRDYFGAHTYKRVDDPDGAPNHTDWKE